MLWRVSARTSLNTGAFASVPSDVRAASTL
jgi:hypothetical protein